MAGYKELQQRYEQLKRMYFNGVARQVDETGEEIPALIDRSIIIKMFENMGVEVPLTPDAPMKPLRVERLE